ncbi:hypothetical protein F2P79_019512 [Pimephales promelas]|nr:hypothetical protein F2P79_019512 [Pimephales promelas]
MLLLTNFRQYCQSFFSLSLSLSVRVSQVFQIFSSVFCILSTFSYTCLTFSCSASLTAPVWCGLFFIATGSLAIDVQRKPKKFKVMILLGLNIFGLLFAVCSFFPFFLKSSQLDKATPQQRIGVNVLKGSGVMSIIQCMFAAMYSLFLIWRGIQSYSASNKKDYISVMQNIEEPTDPLLENEHFSI